MAAAISPWRGTDLPEPNTPAVLYGDDYPGPDEPLYHPQPGGEIWLTDLAGHEDIYDNDGIRLNFAPEFDRSTIGHISWYRNGVPRRFADNQYQITNAQMEMFTGAARENSPPRGVRPSS